MAISKKTRFAIFQRDAFTCQYCGGKPPKAMLELEHITPKSKGGTDDEINLVTSCFDCNRGKGAKVLSVLPTSLDIEELKEYVPNPAVIGYEDYVEFHPAIYYHPLFDDAKLWQLYCAIAFASSVDEGVTEWWHLQQTIWRGVEMQSVRKLERGGLLKIRGNQISLANFVCGKDVRD